MFSPKIWSMPYSKISHSAPMAMAKVKARVPAATLLVVGSSHGGYEDRMLDFAAEQGLGDALVTTGWIDQAEMAKAYAASDVICTPSLIFESFGLINAEGHPSFRLRR